MNWLTELLDQYKEFESPLSFVYWSALAAISASVKDQIYLDKYLYKLYPNIYVMLHADSGVKKSPPINMAASLVKKVDGTRIIEGRYSIQGMLKKLATAYTQPGGHVVKKSVAFICSAELTSSIVEDKAALDILTDLFDRQNRIGAWEQILKSESFELRDPTITMLTATNEAHSNDFLTNKDIHGGYIGRTFIVYERKSKVINSLMFPPKILPDVAKNAEYLKQLSKLTGEFKIDLETRNFFDRWYRDFRYSTENSVDKTGTLNRFDDSVLKVAMLISLGTTPELIITKKAIEQAIELCERLVGNVRKATLASGKSQWAGEKALLIEELLKRDNHAITRQQLNKKYWMHANADEWDKIVVSLETAGMVRLETYGNTILIVMPENIVREMENRMKGKTHD